MNARHYDNLCEIAQTSKLGTQLFVEIAKMYNALDVLCIALDCEDEVQDIAVQLAAAELASEA